MKALLALATDADRPELQEKLELAQKQAIGYDKALSGLALRIGLIDSVCEAIDAFTAALDVVPDGENHSPLTLAMMREQLHSPIGNRFTHVLLVRGGGGSAAQMTDDRPLWSKDKLSVVAAASVTYMIIETEASTIVAAGTLSASAAGHGNIGSRFELEGLAG